MHLNFSVIASSHEFGRQSIAGQIYAICQPDFTIEFYGMEGGCYFADAEQ
jgi:hypothetical protein